MTLAEMETALKRYGFDSGDPLKIWINAAMHDLENEMDWPWLELQALSFNTTAGGSVYPIGGSKIISIRDLTNKRKLNYYDRRKFYRDIQDTTELGKPEIFCLIDPKTMKMWRVPEAVYEMEITLQGNVPDLAAAGDEPKANAVIGVQESTTVWPKDVHYPIVMRAASIALMAENEEERAKMAQSEYDKAVMSLKAGYGERELGEPETVQDVQGYGGDFAVRY